MIMRKQFHMYFNCSTVIRLIDQVSFRCIFYSRKSFNSSTNSCVFKFSLRIFFKDVRFVQGQKIFSGTFCWMKYMWIERIVDPWIFLFVLVFFLSVEWRFQSSQNNRRTICKTIESFTITVESCSNTHYDEYLIMEEKISSMTLIDISRYWN